MKITCLKCRQEVEIIDQKCELCRERLCRSCGCSQNAGCAEICFWVEEDLCSSCFPGARDSLGDGGIYVCLGSPHHLTDLRGLAYPHESVYWTIRKTAEKGDKAIFYLTAPVSAVVGFGNVVRKPWEEPKSDWKEKHFTEINRIRIFDENQFITNRQIRGLFPEWRFMLQPRQSVAMLDEIRQPFWELLIERINNSNEQP